MNSVLLIVPAWNEAASLPATLAELREAAQSVGADIVVVDDGSTDATSQIALDAGVTVLTLPFNVGVGGALRTGFRYAAERGYAAAVQVDADGQHAATGIADLLAALERDQLAVAVGTRFAERQDGEEYQVSAVRGGAMRGLTWMLSALLDTTFTDPSSGFRAFDRRAITLFADRYPVEYLSDTVEALLIAGYEGLPVREVPVRMRPRQAGLPSNRNWRLVYHYLRLSTKVAMTARMDGRRAAQAERAVRAERANQAERISQADRSVQRVAE